MNRKVLNVISDNVPKLWHTETKISGEKKERLISKWALYWKNVLIDYQETVTETFEEARKKPKKFMGYIGGLAFFIYCGMSNPDEASFYDQVAKHANELALVGAFQRNPISENRLLRIQKLSDEGLLRRFSIGIASFMWISNNEKTSGLYAAQCQYLQPKILNFHKHILDVGCFGHQHQRTEVKARDQKWWQSCRQQQE